MGVLEKLMIRATKVFYLGMNLSAKMCKDIISSEPSKTVMCSQRHCNSTERYATPYLKNVWCSTHDLYKRFDAFSLGNL